ncbi:hypothetical protein CPB83DRAFT_899521 [Crepidotus variabilis]|uniref:Glycoside hydrolase 131 catalytic N-terminal domain-containing protein n=1 Tax=Crepidotus variabilis TaxID=179855 RepID=A0A9P6JIZ4_9AGAR|nr:hypothetical protein CPB83DRAFT_899521 [Crepidotus variabilis]
MAPKSLLVALFFVVRALAKPVLWDGRAPFNFTSVNLDASADPYLSVVKGSNKASHYTQLLGNTSNSTPLWSPDRSLPQPIGPGGPVQITPSQAPHLELIEQVIAVSIDNSSVFVPGGNTANSQYGFRRTELLAQRNSDWHNLLPDTQTGITVFHFSIKLDPAKPLNYNHEYQIVFIEPSDGSHVFGIQLGSPFTNPTGTLPVANAHDLKVLDHAKKILYTAAFTADVWHNLAVQVDWSKKTLAVLYSKDGAELQAVTKALPNSSAASGSTGQGEFHFGVLKLPLVNPRDTNDHKNDVVHYGTQEGTTEGLLYSGIFIESTKDGVSIGNGRSIPLIV